MRAAILVSGGGAVTPYTTPVDAAGSGLPAGNTMTAVRAYLLDAGYAVFTAPARIGRGVVEADTGWQGFAEVPVVLPPEMTINAAGAIEDAGAALRAFLAYITTEFDIDALDVVAHSMGGLFTRAALALERTAPTIPPVGRLITLGTPWTGSLLGDIRSGGIQIADARNDASTEAILQRSVTYAEAVSQGAADEVTHGYLAGAGGWNERQQGALDDIAVTLVGGSYFAARQKPARLWPHDGLVSLRSALGHEVSAAVLPRRSTHRLDDVHSIFFADQFGLSWTQALTWDPRVFGILDDALAGVDEEREHLA